MQYLNVDQQEQFISKELADILLEGCNSIFERSNIRECRIFGDDGLIYKTTYNINGKEKITYNNTNSWSLFPELLIVKEWLEKYTSEIFNFCAIMMYADETVVIKKHRDKEIPTGSQICGISLGATRRMQLTYYQNIKIMTLNHGSLYRLLSPTNDYWVHEILPEIEKRDVRYSLTFRNIPNAMHETEIKYCTAVLKSGKRKGESCGNIVYKEGEFCGIHNKTKK